MIRPLNASTLQEGKVKRHKMECIDTKIGEQAKHFIGNGVDATPQNRPQRMARTRTHESQPDIDQHILLFTCKQRKKQHGISPTRSVFHPVFTIQLRDPWVRSQDRNLLR
jgi:hypothetical protein